MKENNTKDNNFLPPFSSRNEPKRNTSNGVNNYSNQILSSHPLQNQAFQRDFSLGNDSFINPKKNLPSFSSTNPSYNVNIKNINNNFTTSFNLLQNPNNTMIRKVTTCNYCCDKIIKGVYCTYCANTSCEKCLNDYYENKKNGWRLCPFCRKNLRYNENKPDEFVKKINVISDCSDRDRNIHICDLIEKNKTGLTNKIQYDENNINDLLEKKMFYENYKKNFLEYLLSKCLDKIDSKFDGIIKKIDKKITTLEGSAKEARELLSQHNNLINDRKEDKIHDGTMIFRLDQGDKVAKRNLIKPRDIEKEKEEEITFIPTMDKITISMDINKDKLLTTDKRGIKKYCNEKLLKDSSITIEYDEVNMMVKWSLNVSKVVYEKYSLFICLRKENKTSQKLYFIKEFNESRCRVYFIENIKLEEFFEGEEDVQVLTDIYIFGFDK